MFYALVEKESCLFFKRHNQRRGGRVVDTVGEEQPLRRRVRHFSLCSCLSPFGFSTCASFYEESDNVLPVGLIFFVWGRGARGRFPMFCAPQAFFAWGRGRRRDGGGRAGGVGGGGRAVSVHRCRCNLLRGWTRKCAALIFGIEK